jgi:hypothetical protein
MPTFNHTRTRLYRAFYESKDFGNGATLVTAKNGVEALKKAIKIGLIVDGVRQDEVKFTEVKFLRWIDAQNHFIWKSDTSKLMNQGTHSW